MWASLRAGGEKGVAFSSIHNTKGESEQLSLLGQLQFVSG